MKVWQLKKFLETCNSNDCVIVEEFRNWSYEKLARGAITVLDGETKEVTKRASDLDNVDE